MALSWDEVQQRIVESSLLTRDEVESIVAALPDFQRNQDGESLSQRLVDRGKLTPFQAKAICGGNGKSLVLGNYVILDQLGQGGMGTVYKAEHRRMRRVVALKVLSPNVVKSPELSERFQREVRAAAKLDHPNIVTAYDADEADGTHFLVMQYVDGQDLSAYVRQHGPLPVKQAVECIVQAARGLQYAHEQGVVHRDIKPANLLVDKSGVVKILDMGLARIDVADENESELTSTGAVMGTVDYMATEQALSTKNADARSDQYSLGLTLWYLLTGRPAYSGDSMMAKLLAHRDAPIPSLAINCPDAPLLLEIVFQKMVAKQPENRYATLADAAEALIQCSNQIEASSAGFSSDTQLETFSQTIVKTEWSATNADESSSAATLITPATPAANTESPAPSKNRIVPWSVAGGVMLSLVMLLIWINRTQTHGGNSDPEPEPTPQAEVWQATAEQQVFFDRVAQLSSDEQLKAVKQKLQEVNPGYDGKGTVGREDGKITTFNLSAVEISELWPVRAFPNLTTLLCRGTVQKPGKLADLSPLAGMPLTHLSIQLTSVSDLTPLAGMPLESLECFSTRVSNLSPLKGLPLTYLNLSNTQVTNLTPLKGSRLTNLSCSNSRVADLSPLAGMPLANFSCNVSQVSDLSPLKGMPLDRLNFSDTKVSDLSPLAGMPLSALTCNHEVVLKHRDLLRSLSTLETINSQPAKDVLSESAPIWKPSPEQQTFFDEVAKLSPQEQLNAVMKKLQEVNPGFDGQYSGQWIQDGKVTRLGFLSVDVSDIWPVRALSDLTHLTCTGKIGGAQGKLHDLSPLAGLPLVYLRCYNTQVSDLSPLAGMKLNYLDIPTTKVTDLSPLAGMPLNELHFYNTPVADLSPLKGLPLTIVSGNGSRISDLSPLAGMKLTQLNCGSTKVTDLSVIEGMELTSLECRYVPISDLSLLKGMPLTRLDCNYTQVADLTPLAGMPLKTLYCSTDRVVDLSPLKGMPLTTLACKLEVALKHHDLLSEIKTLETINGQPAENLLGESTPSWQPMPEQQAFFDEVSKLPPEEQVQAVAKKLQEVNPGFDGQVRYHKVSYGKVSDFSVSATEITDLWPVRAFSGLTSLSCNGTKEERGKFRDLAQLAGMKLKSLIFSYTDVSDLSPLVGMPLNFLSCDRTLVADLSPLRGMPLAELRCYLTSIDDLSPLKDASLTILDANGTKIADLSPLAGMPLTSLNCKSTAVSDLSPIRGLPLTTFGGNDSLIHTYCGLLRNIPTLATINERPANDVLSEFLWKPTPEQQAFFDEVAKMPPEVQVQTVAKKLQEVNPGFDGQVRHRVEDGKVTSLTVSTVHVADLWPVRGLSELAILNCGGTFEETGKVQDLAPLAGLKLKAFYCSNAKIVDLSPLAKMPLNSVYCDHTQVADLSPLKGVGLTKLVCGFSNVSDLSPLEGMPLTVLSCDYTNIESLAPLAGMKLTSLNISKTKISDISVVAGMPLTELHCYLTSVSDLSPLEGASLTHLSANGTQISDLSPLRGMPITKLLIYETRVTDLTPLAGAPLKQIECGQKLVQKHLEFLREIKTLETIKNQPANEVLSP